MATKVVTSKSAKLRAALVAADEAGTITGSMSVLAAKCGMGYAFAYGVADRFGHPNGGTYTDRAATRRATKTVTIDPDTGAVSVVTLKGTDGARQLVTVHADGTVTRKGLKA